MLDALERLDSAIGINQPVEGEIARALDDICREIDIEGVSRVPT